MVFRKMTKGFIVGIFVAFASLMCIGYVYADGEYEGGESDSEHVTCSSFKHGKTGLCNNGNGAGSGGGGASWHLYSTAYYDQVKQPVGSNDVNNGYYGPSWTNYVVLNNAPKINEIMANCPASTNKWYAVYGWEGKNMQTQWGPAKWNMGSIAGASYNGYGAQSWDYVYENILSVEDNSVANTHLKQGVAESIYEYLNQWDPSSFPGFMNSTGYFCVPSEPFTATKYFAQSAVYIDGEDWANTSIVDSWTYEKTNTLEVHPGDTVTIGFLHNPYARRAEDQDSEDVDWKIEFGATSDGGYSIEDSSVTARSGKVNLNTLTEDLYTVESRPYSDGYYSLHEFFRLKFNNNSVGKTYEFCEIYSVDNVQITRVCAFVKVVNDSSTSSPGSPSTTSGKCSEWTPSSFIRSGVWSGNTVEGTTSIASGIINETLTSRKSNAEYSNWKKVEATSSSTSGKTTEVYAMPGDKVTWTNCYYPGVQALASERVSTVDIDSGSSNSTKPAPLQSRLSSWSNNFTVKSQTGSDNVNKIFNKPASVVLSTNATPSISNNNNLTSRLFGVSIANGNSSARYTTNTYTIKKTNDAGKYYKETISTPGTPQYARISLATHRWGCCGKKCTSCRRHTDYFRGYNYAGYSLTTPVPLDSSAQVIVPYNFINTASVALEDTDVVYSGERVTVNNASVTVGARGNDVTKANYATQVDDARVVMLAYVWRGGEDSSERGGRNGIGVGNGASRDDLCSMLRPLNSLKQCEIAEDSGITILNPDGKTEGITHYKTIDKISYTYNSNNELEKGTTKHDNGAATFAETYNVFDASAGDYYCMVMAVYPYASGAINASGTIDDKNTDSKGSDSWYISKPSCRIIAKKPSMQVLGGSIYSSGGISTNVAVKRNIFSAYGYQPKIQDNATVFGSWAEQAVVSNGDVYGLASGAGTGLNSEPTGIGSLEGGDFNLCKYRASLSFANYNSSRISGVCSSTSTVGPTGSAGISSNMANRAALVDYWLPSGVAANASDSITLNDDSLTPITSATGRNIRYAYNSDKNSTLTITGAENIALGTTYIVKAAGDLIISGNISYNNSGSMTSSGQIPKVIIYAGGNITIGCTTVNQIDAILIAEGNVNTCNNYGGSGAQGDANDSARSNQLTIRGVVISNSLTPSRTYGASAGKLGISGGNRDSGSGAPAEVVNYDTSAILWGRYMAGAAESDTLTVTYQHELAPRY